MCMEPSTAVLSMLAYRWGSQAGQVRYRCVGHDEGGPMGCIETFLEAPIRSLAAQDSLQCGSYIISNRGMEHMAMYNEEERRRRANARNQLVNLPITVLLEICSFLDVKALCMLARTCRTLHSAASDELLWQYRLDSDCLTWSMVGHLSHPSVYRTVSSDMTSKEIYRSCTEQLQQAVTGEMVYANPLDRMMQAWHSLAGRLGGRGEAAPKWMMFGSGLDKYSLEKRLFFAEDAPFQISRLYPGREGFGAGVGFTHRGVALNLITLYTSTWSERKAAMNGQGPRVNKLLSAAHSEGHPHTPELMPLVQELCATTRGCILVVSGEPEQSDLTSDQWMLGACLKRSQANLPALVVACHHGNTPSLPAVKIANRLDLHGLPNPWQVLSLSMDYLHEAATGFDWLVKVQS